MNEVGFTVISLLTLNAGIGFYGIFSNKRIESMKIKRLEEQNHNLKEILATFLRELP